MHVENATVSLPGSSSDHVLAKFVLAMLKIDSVLKVTVPSTVHCALMVRSPHVSMRLRVLSLFVLEESNGPEQRTFERTRI